MFSPNDIYTTSGSNKLYNCWTQNVTKYTTSSFYNWEQDNEPVYDLEQRTYHNWEQLGFPTSSIPGLALVVSANTPAATTGCNSNIFPTFSGAIAALPQVIRFPVLIEVATFGDLGAINIHNFKFENRGSLEIVNRNFFRTYSISGIVQNTANNAAVTGVITHFSSLDLSNTIIATSAMSISTKLVSSVNDPRLRGFRSVMADRTYDGTVRYGNHIHVHRGSPNNPFTATASVFNFENYDRNLDGTFDTFTYLLGDAKVFNQQTNTNYLGRNTSIINSNCGAMTYGNFIPSMSIKNCDGPIYLRGFFFDGSAASLPLDTGLEIDGCSRIVVENCAASKYQKTGFLFNNSKVIITRGIAAHRVYGTDPATLLKYSGNFISNTTYENLFHKDYAAGLKAVNSEITFSSTLSVEQTYVPAASAFDFIIGFSKCANGVWLDNSVLNGGISRSLTNSPKTESYFQCERNLEYGIVAKNSKIELDGRLECFNNLNGILADQSNLGLDSFTLENNEKFGIVATNSIIRYNKGMVAQSSFLGNQHQWDFSGNGQHLYLDSSKFIPYPVSSVPANFGKMQFREAHGLDLNIDTLCGHKATIPAIDIKNGSEAVLINAKIVREDTNCNVNDGRDPGTCLTARNGSKATFQGTSGAATIIVGPSLYGSPYQQYRGGVYACDNSLVEFNGPTFIGRFGVDVLAENNSTIKFGPPNNKNAMGIDRTAYGLENPRNHTSVELHSTKACLVVNKGSILDIQHLGDFSGAWGSAGSNLGLSALASSVDFARQNLLGSSVSAGSMQFYPNPNDANDYGGLGIGIASPAAYSDSTEAFSVETNTNKYNYFLTNNIFNPAQTDNFSAITNGGTCVRAVNGSKVNVFNAHFPCGWWNASGLIYDASGADAGTGLCNRTFIWNIADNSTMHAAYLSVSGKYPADAGYFGPSSVYASGGGAVAYGAPSGTPDTSSLSVLDFYGRSSGNIWPTLIGGSLKAMGKNPPENQGPFRLYFSVDPVANYLISQDNKIGWPYQIFSQGYNLSGNFSATPSVSSIYGSVIKIDSAGNLVTSGFYYCSAMVEGDRDKVMLDESAANTFANAKNAAMGTSGRPKLVTITGAHKSLGGEGRSNSAVNFGRGYKSSNVFDIGRDV